jgi:caa(3)-type oxidase subunit IV
VERTSREAGSRALEGALAATSYGISFTSLGTMRAPAAIAISAAKASLVAVFFMELMSQRPTNRFVLTAALLLVVTLLGLMTADALTRDTPPMQPGPARLR